MLWVIYGLLVVGGISALAWIGAKTRPQKRAYGLIAVAIWLVALVLANTML